MQVHLSLTTDPKNSLIRLLSDYQAKGGNTSFHPSREQHKPSAD
jgi:hypothetical protein